MAIEHLLNNNNFNAYHISVLLIQSLNSETTQFEIKIMLLMLNYSLSHSFQAC